MAIRTSILPDGGVIIAATTEAEGKQLLARVFGTETPSAQKQPKPTCDCRDYGSAIVCEICRPDLIDVFKNEAWSRYGDNAILGQMADGKIEVLGHDTRQR